MAASSWRATRPQRCWRLCQARPWRFPRRQAYVYVWIYIYIYIYIYIILWRFLRRQACLSRRCPRARRGRSSGDARPPPPQLRRRCWGRPSTWTSCDPACSRCTPSSAAGRHGACGRTWPRPGAAAPRRRRGSSESSQTDTQKPRQDGVLPDSTPPPAVRPSTPDSACGSLLSLTYINILPSKAKYEHIRL